MNTWQWFVAVSGGSIFFVVGVPWVICPIRWSKMLGWNTEKLPNALFFYVARHLGFMAIGHWDTSLLFA